MESKRFSVFKMLFSILITSVLLTGVYYAHYKKTPNLAEVEAKEVPNLLKINNKFGIYEYHHIELPELINDRFLTPTYYKQNDYDWGYKRFGSYRLTNTGCVPTSLAMVLEPLLGRQVLPAEVAQVMYNEGYLNNHYYGAGAPGIEYVAEYYGLKSDRINSKEELIQALSDGKFVVAAMNPGNFCPSGYTHEIVLYDYNDGIVSAYDPLWKWHNGEYKIDLIYRQKSRDWLDCYYGDPFFAIYRNDNLNDNN